NPADLTNLDGTLFFTISPPKDETELWQSDGTDEGTVPVQLLAPTSDGIDEGTAPVASASGHLDSESSFPASTFQGGVGSDFSTQAFVGPTAEGVSPVSPGDNGTVESIVVESDEASQVLVIDAAMVVDVMLDPVVSQDSNSRQDFRPEDSTDKATDLIQKAPQDERSVEKNRLIALELSLASSATNRSGLNGNVTRDQSDLAVAPLTELEMAAALAQDSQLAFCRLPNDTPSQQNKPVDTGRPGHHSV